MYKMLNMEKLGHPHCTTPHKYSTRACDIMIINLQWHWTLHYNQQWRCYNTPILTDFNQLLQQLPLISARLALCCCSAVFTTTTTSITNSCSHCNRSFSLQIQHVVNIWNLIQRQLAQLIQSDKILKIMLIFLCNGRFAKYKQTGLCIVAVY
jgi:hypothetical protein